MRWDHFLKRHDYVVVWFDPSILLSYHLVGPEEDSRNPGPGEEAAAAA